MKMWIDVEGRLEIITKIRFAKIVFTATANL